MQYLIKLAVYSIDKSFTSLQKSSIKNLLAITSVMCQVYNLDYRFIDLFFVRSTRTMNKDNRLFITYSIMLMEMKRGIFSQITLWVHKLGVINK